MTKTKVVSFRIPIESYDKILIECEKKGISVSEWYERKIAIAKSRNTKTNTNSNLIELQLENNKKVKLFLGLLNIILFISVSIVFFYYSKENNGITQKYEKTMDSLNNELFIKQIEADRYKVALELFKEEDSVAADKFHFILVTKTE
jgi:hypothetical protein